MGNLVDARYEYSPGHGILFREWFLNGELMLGVYDENDDWMYSYTVSKFFAVYPDAPPLPARLQELPHR